MTLSGVQSPRYRTELVRMQKYTGRRSGAAVPWRHDWSDSAWSNDRHCPVATVRRRARPMTPWFDAECRAARRRARAAERRFQRLRRWRSDADKRAVLEYKAEDDVCAVWGQEGQVLEEWGCHQQRQYRLKMHQDDDAIRRCSCQERLAEFLPRIDKHCSFEFVDWDETLLVVDHLLQCTPQCTVHGVINGI